MPERETTATRRPSTRVRLVLTPTLLFAVGVLALLVILLGLLVVRLFRNEAPVLRLHEPVPDFALATFDGRQVSLADLRGQGVVLNFWASWCGPCRDEAPLLERAWRAEAAAGLAFVGVAHLDQLPAALRYIEEFGITYPNGRDSGNVISDRYGVRGVPKTFFIDPQGRLAHTVTGPLTDAAAFQRHLDLIRP